MSKYTVKSKKTEYKSIVKFETNQFLVTNETFQFNDSKEAEGVPLAQILFSFPYVKTVYIAQNFIATKISEDIEWKDVKNEIYSTIKDHLNSGKTIINPKPAKPGKKFAISVYTESTPNPMVIKFVCNRKLVINSIQYGRNEEAENSPMTLQLFEFPYVRNVFYNNNYISITRMPKADWNEIVLELREFIRIYLQKGKSVLIQESEYSKNSVLPEDEVEKLDPISKQVISILQNYIKATPATDGGNIRLHSYDSNSKKVNIIMEGSCQFSPALKNNLGEVLKEQLPEKIDSIQSINR